MLEWPYKGGSGSCIFTADFVKVIQGLVASPPDSSDHTDVMVVEGEMKVKAGVFSRASESGSYKSSQFIVDCHEVTLFYT